MSTFESSLHPRTAATGQFREKENSAPVGHLTDPAPADQYLARKREAYAQRGFVPATSGPSSAGSPLSAENIDGWWMDAHMRTELAAEEKSFPVIPDDYTPSGGAGRALSGKRRTYRRTYQSGEIAIRMPSAAAIRRFSTEIDGGTFDVPISAQGPAGNPIAGHVRVTQTSPGNWAVTAINMPPAAQAKVAEAVNAVLEARRVSVALDEVEKAGGLIEAAHARRAAGGAKMVENERSEWIRSTGYNDDTGEAVLNLQGRLYAYEVPRGVYEYVASAPSPGSAYNSLIKGRYPSHGVDTCGNCRRTYRQGAAHSCPTHRAPTGRVTMHGKRIRAFLLGEQAPAIG